MTSRHYSSCHMTFGDHKLCCHSYKPNHRRRLHAVHNCSTSYALRMDQNSEGPLYCAEQIKVPAELPDILKEFTKAAIRTHPTDLLQWSAA